MLSRISRAALGLLLTPVVVMLGIPSNAGRRTVLAQSNPEAPKALSQDRPSFEVASVRPATKDPNLLRLDPRLPQVRSGGRFEAEARLRILIGWAFRNTPTAVEGSFRVLDDVFAITAKAEGAVLLTRPGEVGPMNRMLQSLLAERFKLRVRWEPESLPVYALRRTTTEQLGRNLKRLNPTCDVSYPEKVLEAPDGCVSILRTNRGQVKGFVSSMADFAKFVGPYSGRRVVDETGLVGAFELSTAFNPRSDRDYGPLPEEHLPSLRDALKNDLGLKLEEGGRRDFPRLIVEHVEQPTEN